MKIDWSTKYILLVGDTPGMYSLKETLEGQVTVKQSITKEECKKYHWIILFDQFELYEYCQDNRIFVTCYGDRSRSDILLDNPLQPIDFGIYPSSAKSINSIDLEELPLSSIHVPPPENGFSSEQGDIVDTYHSYLPSIHKFISCPPSPKSTTSVDSEDTLLSSLSIPQGILKSPSGLSKTKTKGTLYLVGAGPGSLDYLTLKAYNLIMTKPILITDVIVSDLFSSIQPRGKVLTTNKIKGSAQKAQEEIHDWITSYLEMGLDVVRVKGGDPFLFGRGGEEWNLARSKGFPVEYVPGVSSCYSAPGLGSIPVTHRGVADSFVVMTGQTKDGKVPIVPEYLNTRTVVLLMSITTLEKVMDSFIKRGYPPEIPVACVYKASYPDQRVIKGNLTNISRMVQEQGIRNHATVVLGDVVSCLS